MDQPEGTRVRRRRTEYGKRSKQGCRTCISKKVKCDEQRPQCKRCIRLDLHCEWAENALSLASRRRGLGPIKGRDSWTPQVISPKTSGCGTRGQQQSDSDILSDSTSELLEPAVQEDREIQPAVMHLDQILQRADPTLDLPERSIKKSSVLTETDHKVPHCVSMCQPTFTQPNSDQASIRHQQADVPQQGDISQQSTMTTPMLLSPLLQSKFLTASTSTLPSAVPAVMVGGSDYRAVKFHRIVFAPLKSTRSAAVSAHSIFLDRAFSNTMALHFLLAVSHSELALYQGRGIYTPPESWQHFNRGSQLLFDASNIISQSDHVGVLLSFLYMYMFWMRRDPFNASILRELSRSVLLHVKTYALDDLCANAELNESGISTLTDKTLLSRILTYLYDRDGFCYFFGCGGAFASYVNEHHDKRAHIWQLSQMGFSASTSDRLGPAPAAQPTISRDAKVTEVYFQLIAIHHDINRYSQDAEAQNTEQEARIRCELERMEKEQRWLFEMVADCKTQASLPSLMALVAVTFYYALQIYFYRSRDSSFGELPIPARVQFALSELVATAYYTVATGPVQLLERFQWALLIAGTETRDPIHQEWISRTITDPGMKSALQLILDAKKMRCISMQAIRQLVSGVTYPS